MINVKELPMLGKCLTCAQNSDCPMKVMLPQHLANIAAYGENYEDVRPDLWDQDAIEEPEFSGEKMIWCPLYIDGEY